MKLLGYTDRLNVAPGEKIQFMVSCDLPNYQADIVRLVHGDRNPRGPGFKERPVTTEVSGEYPGRKQALRTGSYLVLPNHPLLDFKGSFTIQAFIYPTTPLKGLQGIISNLSPNRNEGYGLFIAEDGSLAFLVGSQNGQIEQLKTGKPLRAGEWYFAVGVFDAKEGKITLHQNPLNQWPLDQTESSVGKLADAPLKKGNHAPLLIAAYWGQDSNKNPEVHGLYNGKIANPQVFNRVLNKQELEFLRSGSVPLSIRDAVVASWDFAQDFGSSKITDSSVNKLHGYAVNIPTRAVTGHNWSMNETNFNTAPQEYGAIHFHDDDLDDAQWAVDFDLVVAEDLPSGIYAAKLVSGQHQDYLPFFVRPKKGTASAEIVFLVPTFSYLAYANFRMLTSPDARERAFKRLGENVHSAEMLSPEDEYIAQHQLNSLYDLHSDGTGVCYSSYLRPILNMRPNALLPLLDRGRGAPHQLSADLHLTDWLETMEYPFDVITDHDLHAEGKDVLDPYKVVITGSHPEYWSGEMLDGLQAYLSNGGRVMYLGGNGFYWVTTPGPEQPHIVEVRRWLGTRSWDAAPGEFYHSTTGELGGLWRAKGRPPQQLVGVGFSASGGIDTSSPYHRLPDSKNPRASFIFKGVGENEIIGNFGLVQGGAAGWELDRADANLGTPPHALVVATATQFSNIYQHAVEEVFLMNAEQGGEVNPFVRSDMVYFEGPKGGGVFSVGSITWCGSLSHNNYDNNVSTITENVLQRFLSEEPLG